MKNGIGLSTQKKKLGRKKNHNGRKKTRKDQKWDKAFNDKGTNLERRREAENMSKETRRKKT